MVLLFIVCLLLLPACVCVFVCVWSLGSCCHEAVHVLCLFIVVSLFGLRSAIVAFPGHTYLVLIVHVDFFVYVTSKDWHLS